MSALQEGRTLAVSEAFQIAGDCQRGWERVEEEHRLFRPVIPLDRISQLIDFEIAVTELDDQGAGASQAVGACLHQPKHM